MTSPPSAPSKRCDHDRGCFVRRRGLSLGKQLHRAHLSSQQITMEPRAGHHWPDTLTQMTAATTPSPLEAEVDRMAAMLEKLVAVLARSNPTEPTQRPLRLRVEAPRPAALCWVCGDRGHLRANCPQSKKGLNSHGPRTPSNPAGRK